MLVKVEVELSVKPTKNHKVMMRDAASELTNDRRGIQIYESPDKESALIAEFTMNQARSADVVGKIGDKFSQYVGDYDTSTIWFPKG